MRGVLLHLALFFLPFAAYALYLLLARTGTRFVDGPMARLTLIGLGLVIASLIALAAFTGADPDKTYIPPSYEDGEIRPGRFD